jgi:hypothetical protein
MNRIYESLYAEFNDLVKRKHNTISCGYCNIIHECHKFTCYDISGNTIFTSYTSLPMLTFASSYIYQLSDINRSRSNNVY